MGGGGGGVQFPSAWPCSPGSITGWVGGGGGTFISVGSNSGIKMGGRKDDTEKEERGTIRNVFAIILGDQLK